MPLPAVIAGAAKFLGSTALKTGVKKAATNLVKKKGKEAAKNFIKRKAKEKGGALVKTSKEKVQQKVQAMLGQSPRNKGGALVKPKEPDVKLSAGKIGFDKLNSELTSIVSISESIKGVFEGQLENKKKQAVERKKNLAAKRRAAREKLLEGAKRTAGIVSSVAASAKGFDFMNFLTNILIGGILLFLLKNLSKIKAALGFLRTNLYATFLGLRGVFQLFKLGLKQPGKLLRFGFRAFLKTVSGLGKRIFVPIGNALKKGGKALLTGIKNIGSAIFNFGKGIFKKIVDFAARTPILKNVVKYAKQLKNLLSKPGKASFNAIKRFVKPIKSTVKAAASAVKGTASVVGRGVSRAPGRLIAKLFGKEAAKNFSGISKVMKGVAKAAKGIRIPIVGPIIVAISSLLSGDPPTQTLFKAVGTGLGEALGTLIPIPVLGTILGGLIGEYGGDLLYTLLKGGGIKAVGEKIAKDFQNVWSMAGKAYDWMMSGFSRFYDSIPKIEMSPFDLIGMMVPMHGPMGGMAATALRIIGNVANASLVPEKHRGFVDMMLNKVPFPDPFYLANPFNLGDKFGKLKDAFFPPSGQLNEPVDKEGKVVKALSEGSGTDFTGGNVTTSAIPQTTMLPHQTGGNFTGKGIQKEMYDYLRTKGLTHNHAMGIMANIMRESSFRPWVVGDNGDSYGLFQWNHAAGRRDPMVSAVPDWKTNWKGQIDYALQEFTGPQYLKKTFSSAQAAADWWMEKWEIPADTTSGSRKHAAYLQSAPLVRTATPEQNIMGLESPEETGGDPGSSLGPGTGLKDVLSQRAMTVNYGVASGPVRTRGRGGGHGGVDIGTGGQKGWYVAFKMKGTVSLNAHLSGYGNTLIINVGDKDFLFAHLAQPSPLKKGTQYNGQIIGEIGNTGRGSGEHLHFEVRPHMGGGGSDIDPEPYIKYLVIGKMGDGSAVRTQSTSAQIQPSAQQQSPHEPAQIGSSIPVQRDVDSQLSYEQNSTTIINTNGVNMPELPILGGGKKRGMIGGVSTTEVLNSYYRRQLLGKLYKVG